MEREKDYFYWQNRQGIIERHHVSEWRTFIEREYPPDYGWARKPTSSPGKDTGQSVPQTGGESTSEAANRPLRAVEEKRETEVPISTMKDTSSKNQTPSRASYEVVEAGK